MKKYIYHIVTLKYHDFIDPMTLKERLDDEGDEGWELVNTEIQSQPGGGREMQCIFKKGIYQSLMIKMVPGK